jgi:hypothetical protein
LDKIAEEAVEAEEKNQIAGLFVNAAMGIHEKPDSQEP